MARLTTCANQSGGERLGSLGSLGSLESLESLGSLESLESLESLGSMLRGMKTENAVRVIPGSFDGLNRLWAWSGSSRLERGDW